MLLYCVKRLIHAAIVVWLVITVVFFIVRLVPGGPVDALLGADYTPEAARVLERRLGLDQPLIVQYGEYLGRTLSLDLGDSVAGGTSVRDMLVEAIPRTLSLTLIGLVVGLLLAIPLGARAARRRNRIAGPVSSGVGLIGLSLPTFWLGMLLILLMAVDLGWLPAYGYAPMEEGLGQWLGHILMPGTCLGLAYAAPLVLITRSSMAEALREPYAQMARAKGLRESVIMAKHVVPNAFIPVITMAGIHTGGLLSGAVVTETVFAINGVGRVLVDAITNRDYPAIQGVILLISVVFVVVNILVDLLYAVLNPRIRLIGGTA
ncbi:ABC transporter permease [Nonomuraea sp. K274]|uniref:ABC transporter permease n=1 Tax=Nonomuraea cypriaca TaxID=1187855 RepID=A0A931EXJ6_9ACTN|nr:ABC transporter permease [Nonomuraea cypriaca]MBF8184221.1 ABC transporter permease [Nonomuraea cypriaca]